MNVNILPVSLYFSIYGIVYEVNLPEKKDFMPESISVASNRSSVAIHADWVCDYTGYVYKCRDPEYKEVKTFLLSERASFKKFKNIGELKEFLDSIHPIVNAFREWEIKRYK